MQYDDVKMRTMNSKTSFGRYIYPKSCRIPSLRKASAPSDEDSDSEEDERERRKYLSLQGGQSFFWSANRLNKNFTTNKTECFDEMSFNYLTDRTASMSSFKRNVHVRHSLKHHRRRPLSNINNIELYDKLDTNLKLSRHTFVRPLPVALDDIEMNNNFEYGFNPQRASGSKAHIQVRLRPISVCTPPMEKRENKGIHQTGSYFILAKLSPKIISYATNEYEVELEKELLNLRSQSCNLNFQGCEGNRNEKELKEDIAMARRQRFVRRKLSFEYLPKKKWKKTVSLDSGLATVHTLPNQVKSKLDASKSEELLNDQADKRHCKMGNRKKKTKSVEFLDVRKESNDETNIEHDLAVSSEVEQIQTIDNLPCENNEEQETFSSACEITGENLPVPHIPVEAPSGGNLTDVSSTTPLEEAPLSTPILTNTPSDNISLETSSEKLDSTKSSEKGKRIKSSIPHIFSSFRLPNKSTFRKLMRKKAMDATTPLKASHDIVSTELFKDKSEADLIENNVINLQNIAVPIQNISQTTPDIMQQAHDKNTVESITIKDKCLVGMATEKEDVMPIEDLEIHEIPTIGDEEKVAELIEDPCTLDEMQSVSMDSLNSYGKSMEKHEMIDKSISAYSLPRVDEDKEFSSSLERRSRSSCSISLTKAKRQSRNHEGPHVRRMSETDLAWDERPIRCSPGKRFMRRILSPVVCGLPPPDKYGMLNYSMHSLNSYDSGSIASDSEHNAQLFDFSSQELVEEMTMIDKELLVHIPWEELSVLGWMSPDKFLLAPNIMKMVQFFNRIAMLVTTNVLVEESAYRRAKVIKKAIKLAYKCRYVKNYNSLKAVLGGLQCTPVFRLKATWKEVPSRYRRIFRELSELMSEENNFANYRKELDISLLDPPCIPFLGNFLTEVAHTHAFQAVHAKYRAATVLAGKESAAWKSDVYKKDNVINIPVVDLPTEHANHDSLERLLFKKNHSRTDSEHSNPGLLHDPPHINGKNHSRTDSDDSGVVLSVKRYSNYSEDLESPRESCFSSPDEDSRNIEEHILQNESLKSCFDEQSQLNYDKLPIDSLEIGNRKDPTDGSDKLHECECMFWKYQINCVAYNFMKRPYICRYLVNCPFDTEEDSYKLSLKREAPKR